MERLLDRNQAKQRSRRLHSLRVWRSAISYHLLDVSLNFSPWFLWRFLIMTSMYTREMSAITSLVENARERYLETSRPSVVIHTADQVGPLSFFETRYQTLTIRSNSPTSVHPLTGVAPRIKFVGL